MSRQKKLLLLGGTQISLQILQAAKSMGLLVYVADYFENSPCKKYSDKNFLVSATDIDAISKIIEDEKIDGVLMGYADVLMDSYVDICDRTGLPCYANKHAIEITSRKQLFKDYCREFNVPVVPEFSLDDVINDKVTYPIITKPVDNSGARGIYICANREDFDKYYPMSLKASPSQNVLIEKYIEAPEATIFYYLSKGGIYLLGIGDRWMYDQGNNLLKLPVGYTFPSKYIEQFIQHQDADIKAMFKSLDMKEGMVFMQCFVENGQYVIYEMGYRLTGSIEHHLMEAQYGFNHLNQIINFAVGNPIDKTALLTLDPSKCCMANVSLLLDEGTIDSYEGINNLKENFGVIDYHLSYNIGDSISNAQIGKLSQLGLRVLVTAPNYGELLDSMDAVKNSVHAYDLTGREMFIKNYTYKSICK